MPSGADANKRLVWKLVVMAMLALGFGFALVPFYNLLCEATGLNGKAEGQRVLVGQKVDKSRWVTVEFTGTVMPGLPWDMRPTKNQMEVHPGEVNLATYVVRNMGSQPTVGQAIPSISPGLASRDFHKIQCFCFNQQPLKAGEQKEMPVTFIVGSDLPQDVKTITLSYSFFKALKQN